LVLLAVALVALVPISAVAADILTDETIVISAPVDDDLYLYGADIRVDSNVTGDVTAFGARVRIAGDVGGSVFIAAAEVYVFGDVGGSVVVASRSLLITGNVGHAVRAVTRELDVRGARIDGDLVVAASEVFVDAQSPVASDVRLRSGAAELLGGVGGEVRGSADALILGGLVEGAIDVRVEQLRFEDSAIVTSPVRYTSNHEYLVQRGASISGEATRITPDSPSIEQRFGRTIVFIVFRFGWAFMLALFLLRIAPDVLRRSASTLIERPGRSAGFGLLALFVAPITIVFLLVSVIGLPIAIVLSGMLLLTLYASQIVVGAVVGSMLVGRSWRPSSDAIGKATVALGLAIIVILRSLPIPNWYGFTSTVVAVLALGALSQMVAWRQVVEVDDRG